MSNSKKPVANKKVRNAQKIEYAGISFNSKLEVYCYKKLKEANLSFKYEGQRFELLPPFIFTGKSYEMRKTKEGKTFKPVTNKIRAMTYTPDFIGYYPHTKKKVIIETKGSKNDAFPLRWKLFKYLIVSNNIDADLFMPRNHKQVDEMVDIIKNYKGE